MKYIDPIVICESSFLPPHVDPTDQARRAIRKSVMRERDALVERALNLYINPQEPIDIAACVDLCEQRISAGEHGYTVFFDDKPILWLGANYGSIDGEVVYARFEHKFLRGY